MKRALGLLLLGSALAAGLRNGESAPIAATPPMGWNSWDGYGTTINEEQFKANARWLAEHLKRYGWEYAVVDMQWYVTNPVPEGNSKTARYALDAYGRYIPDETRFPSAAGGKGFRPLGDFVHSLGLKFGIHILRGLPKVAVDMDVPVAGSGYRTREAADTAEACPWNPDNYGADGSKPAARAYYDSLAALYAGWGADLIKVDCISSRPYRAEEIRLLSEALRKTGRPIVLSLSPGPAPLEKAEEMGRYAHMWRISNDVWDLWHSEVEYPKGLGDQFENLVTWAGKGQPGSWPDADMLPLGYLGPAPGWGKPRASRLTRDEQRTLVTLWSIFRSPLMVGGDLTACDPWTVSLLSNPEVIAVDQHSSGSRPAIVAGSLVFWTAEAAGAKGHYVAVFNRGADPAEYRASWRQLGLPEGTYTVRDLWERKELGHRHELSGRLPPHGSLLFRVARAD